LRKESQISTSGRARPRASTCDTDRLRLASLDHDLRFRQILDQANRANVSFYPIDPRGIVPFDDDIVPLLVSDRTRC